MKKIAVVIIACIIPTISFANTSEPKIQVLMEALGLVDMWSEQIELGKIQSKKMGEQMLGQLMSELNPNAEFQERFSGAFNNYMSKIEAPWTAEEIVSVWASFYGPNFSDDELDKLIEFYTSELGKKDVTVTKVTMTKFTEYYQAAWQPILEKAMQEYLEELKIVAAECRCRKVAQ